MFLKEAVNTVLNFFLELSSKHYLTCMLLLKLHNKHSEAYKTLMENK